MKSSEEAVVEVLEGFGLKLWDGSVWAVKGVEHPPHSRLALPRIVAGRNIWALSEALECAVDTYPWLLERSAELYGFSAPLVPLNGVIVLDPIAKAEEIMKNGSAPQAYRELLKHLASAADLVGVTGSMLFRGEPGSDVDLVVYGEKNCYRAYKLLQDLAVEQHLQEKSMVEAEAAPWKRRLIAAYKGVPYSIRLVPYTKPLKPRRVVKVAQCKVRARVLQSSYTTPAVYPLSDVEVLEAPTWAPRPCRLYTVRLRFTEIPPRTRIEAKGWVEIVGGEVQICPDAPGGYVRIIDSGM